jgi:hypothetical protein
MKNEYGCCGHKPKKIPYGSKKGKFWCSTCDAGHANGISKKRERSSASKLIKKELEES